MIWMILGSQLKQVRNQVNVFKKSADEVALQPKETSVSACGLRAALLELNRDIQNLEAVHCSFIPRYLEQDQTCGAPDF